MAKKCRFKLRRNVETQDKIRHVTYNADEEIFDAKSGDEYVPIICGVFGCKEDIFTACHKDNCKACLCYDHMDTTCDEHKFIINECSNQSLRKTKRGRRPIKHASL